MISSSNEQLQQQLEYILLKLNCQSWGISKMQFGREETLEEWYAIKFSLWLEKKMPQKRMEYFKLLFFRAFCMNQASIFEWHERFKEGRKSVRDDERCGRSKEVNTPKLIGQRVRVRVTMLRFKGSSGRDSVGRDQHSSNRVSGIFQQDNAAVYNSILVADSLTKMVIKRVPRPPYNPDIAPCGFWLFPKLRGCRYETIQLMEEAVTKVIHSLTQKDFHCAFPKFLEQYNKCIAARGDYFEGD